uniref:C-type lectin domain-containing protein n=1 Tax=Esox lucius TaxID=8010 RepID=A0A6Q2YXB8_ESOLU
EGRYEGAIIVQFKHLIVLIGLCTLCVSPSGHYHFVDIQKSWSEAQSYCRERYLDLVTIRNTEDMYWLNNSVKTGFNGKAWIGLHDENSWRWNLEDPAFYGQGETEYRNWNPVEPNNNGGNELCVEIRMPGNWNDIPCNIHAEIAKLQQCIAESMNKILHINTSCI